MCFRAIFQIPETWKFQEKKMRLTNSPKMKKILCKSLTKSRIFEFRIYKILKMGVKHQIKKSK
jgi:hypothetical protein